MHNRTPSTLLHTHTAYAWEFLYLQLIMSSFPAIRPRCRYFVVYDRSCWSRDVKLQHRENKCMSIVTTCIKMWCKMWMVADHWLELNAFSAGCSWFCNGDAMGYAAWTMAQECRNAYLGTVYDSYMRRSRGPGRVLDCCRGLDHSQQSSSNRVLSVCYILTKELFIFRAQY